MTRGHLLPAAALALAAMATVAGCESQTKPDSEDGAGNGTPTPTPTPTGDGDDDGGDDDVDDDIVEQLTDRLWWPMHVAVDGTEYPRSPNLTVVHMKLPDSGNFIDEGGCRYGSDVTVSGDTLLLGEVVKKETDCAEEDGGAFEENFLHVFQGSLTYELDDEDGPGMNQPATLTLTNPKVGTIILTESVPIPLPSTD